MIEFLTIFVVAPILISIGISICLSIIGKEI